MCFTSQFNWWKYFKTTLLFYWNHSIDDRWAGLMTCQKTPMKFVESTISSEVRVLTYWPHPVLSHTAQHLWKWRFSSLLSWQNSSQNVKKVNIDTGTIREKAHWSADWPVVPSSWVCPLPPICSHGWSCCKSTAYYISCHQTGLHQS